MGEQWVMGTDKWPKSGLDGPKIINDEEEDSENELTSAAAL